VIAEQKFSLAATATTFLSQQIPSMNYLAANINRNHTS
jgi:hypothetical protein